MAEAQSAVVDAVVVTDVLMYSACVDGSVMPRGTGPDSYDTAVVEGVTADTTISLIGYAVVPSCSQIVTVCATVGAVKLDEQPFSIT